jgi:serpin B
MRHRFAIPMMVIIGLSTACSTGGPGVAMVAVDRAPSTGADAVAAADAVNAFGLDIYSQLAADGDNLVFSPSSIALALAMARAGARGTTAEEMDAVLHEVASDEHAAWLNALDLALGNRTGTFRDASDEEQEVTLGIANTSFAQGDMNLEQAYLEALASRFGSGVQLVDFRSETEAARRLINAWVNEQTRQRIPELLQPGVLDEMTRLALVNAIYLKAAWQNPFEEELTSDGRFALTDGSRITVPMMSLLEPLPYARGDEWEAVELPYVGGSLAMTVIVPDDIAAFEGSLDPDVLASVVGALEERSVQLSFPRFGIETKTELGEVLAALGMPTAFTDMADFSGITTDYPLAISAVVHQANIDVDEAGTEAAAATAVIIGAVSAPIVDVTLDVDRPFLFALRDKPTGAVLFLGRVMDPSQG